LPDSRFARLPTLRWEVGKSHRVLFRQRPQEKFPETVYCASYQDGLMHALDRGMSLAHTGEYSYLCVLIRKIHHYRRTLKMHLRRHSYYDPAYTEGYINGLIVLAEADDIGKCVPLYYVFGARDQPLTFARYRLLAAKAASLNRRAYEQAKRNVKNDGAMQAHHRPFLEVAADFWSD
jgi:hypothetical protein